MASLKSYLEGLANLHFDAGRQQPKTESKKAEGKKAGSKKAGNKKKINLALQGGGAHGAFTWGVADQLLADGRLEVTGISGASAGAINAVMIADGLARGGPDEARKRLAAFWRAASTGGDLPPVQRAVTDRLFSLLPFATGPVHGWLEAMARHFSPYELNPLNINPLRDLIDRFVDFEAVRGGDLDLFVSTTNVHTGRTHIFPREKIDADVVMASAALPLLFRAVEIDGVPHWDGGYMSNPPMFPFLQTTEADDIVIVQINPVQRETTPRTSGEIVNRLNEITFNSALIAEMRSMEFVNRLIDDGHLSKGAGGNGYRRLNIHRIDLGGLATRLNGASKLKTDFEFFDLMQRAGQRAAQRFLDENYEAIGVRSSIDVAAESGVEWA